MSVHLLTISYYWIWLTIVRLLLKIMWITIFWHPINCAWIWLVKSLHNINTVTKTVISRATKAIGQLCQFAAVVVAELEVLLYVHRNCRFTWDGSPGRPPRLSCSSWALFAAVHDHDTQLMCLKILSMVCIMTINEQIHMIHVHVYMM